MKLKTFINNPTCTQFSSSYIFQLQTDLISYDTAVMFVS